MAALAGLMRQQAPEARVSMAQFLAAQIDGFADTMPGAEVAERRPAAIGSWSAMVGDARRWSARSSLPDRSMTTRCPMDRRKKDARPGRPGAETACGMNILDNDTGLDGHDQLAALMKANIHPPIGEPLEFALVELERGRVVFEGSPPRKVFNPIGSVEKRH